MYGNLVTPWSATKVRLEQQNRTITITFLPSSDFDHLRSSWSRGYHAQGRQKGQMEVSDSRRRMDRRTLCITLCIAPSWISFKPPIKPLPRIMDFGNLDDNQMDACCVLSTPTWSCAHNDVSCLDWRTVRLLRCMGRNTLLQLCQMRWCAVPLDCERFEANATFLKTKNIATKKRKRVILF